VSGIHTHRAVKQTAKYYQLMVKMGEDKSFIIMPIMQHSKIK